MGSTSIRKGILLTLIPILILFIGIPAYGDIDISDSPVDTKVTAAPPIVMFILDDSGSMDWEFIVEGQSEGKYEGADEYLYTNSDNVSGNTIGADEHDEWKATWHGFNKMYYNPLVAYNPWPTMSDANTTTPRSNPINASPTYNITNEYYSITASGSTIIIDNDDAGFSKTGNWYYENDHNEGYNRDFYDSSVNNSFSGGSGVGQAFTARWTPAGLTAGQWKVYAWWRSFPNYSNNAPYTVKRAGGTDTVLKDQQSDDGYNSNWNTATQLLGTFTFNGDGTDYVELAYTPGADNDHVCADAVKFEKLGGAVSIKRAHYYTFVDSDDDGNLDAGETLYLVNFNAGVREYYQVTESSGDVTNLTAVAAADLPAALRPKNYDDNGNFLSYKDDAADLQNFANWFQYYRRRELTAKAAVGSVINSIEGAQVGIYSINDQIKQTVLPVKLEVAVLQVVIMDEDHAGFTKSGSWFHQPSHSGEGYERDFYDTSVNNNFNNGIGQNFTARWTPSNLSAGDYIVSAYWRSYDSYAADVPYTVKHAGGTSTVTKNQRANENTWMPLGTYTFTGDGTEYVEINHTPGNNTDHACADAVKFEQISGGQLANVDQSNSLLTTLYGMNSSGGTPLRIALKRVGQYLDYNDGQTGNLGSSPFATEATGGACQQAFAILMTDGFWNGSSPGVGNQDSGAGAPYQDGYDDTLADVAMKYYKEDLVDGVSNQVPTNSCDSAAYQHMVTYTVSFGQTGTLTPPDADGDGFIDDPCFLEASTTRPTWPNPTSGDSQKIDDLWHAAVNGRGAFYPASNPKELIDSLTALFENIGARKASGASVSVNGEELSSSTILYQSLYSTGTWTGDVVAYPVNPTTGAVNREASAIKWKASEQIQNQNWDTGRLIVTYNGTDDGIPFRYSELTNTQKTALGSDLVADSAADLEAKKILEYIRGKTVANFRTRGSKLGDIVHSAPVLLGNTVFVGANDGMLHGFNATTGQERFGFIPNLVFSNLTALKETTFSHKFFVDQTPTVQQNVTGSGITGSISMLVGGLGKGGKGYFALNVTDADDIDPSDVEATAADMVLWEYPKEGVPDTDMGYSYAKPTIARSNDASYPWIIVFGNGYNSSGSKAVLYIMNTDGSVIKKIDTGAGGDNGMSTTALIDVNNDFKVDYVYAGDLKGNLWKFDLTSSDKTNWDVAFKSGATPKPLFQYANHAITAKPDVMRHADNTGYMVVFATGKYLGETDRTDMTLQTIFGIWDYGDDEDDSEYLGTFDSSVTPSLSNQANNVALLEQTEIDWQTVNDNSLRTLSNTAPNWKTVADATSGQDPNIGSADSGETVHAGWYFKLIHSSQASPTNEGERVVKDVQIRDGKAIIISITPNTDACSGGGNSIVHEIDAATGGRLDEAQFDINDDGVIDENDLVTPTDPDSHGLRDAQNNPIKIAPTGHQFTGILYPPVYLTMPDKEREMKLFSTSAGTTTTIFEKKERKQMVYWRIR
ncbi:MAG TPA: hypothetical protein HPQ03_10380 [Deltaproteobacteria bacterium]|nr:hypothetical protein [Deltaproteobacteria bacterium]